MNEPTKKASLVDLKNFLGGYDSAVAFAAEIKTCTAADKQEMLDDLTAEIADGRVKMA